jgi:hypothetical protein
MFFNRAISNGAKWYTPEVFAGAPVYTPEELGANVDENGDVVQTPQPQNTPAQQADFAQQRIAEEKAKTEAAAKQQDAPPFASSPAADWRPKFQQQLSKLLDHVGDEGFGDLLMAFGVKGLNDIQTKAQAADFWRRYAQPALDKPKAAAATETPFDATEAGEDPDSWVPDNIGGAK